MVVCLWYNICKRTTFALRKEVFIIKGSLQIKSGKYYAVFRINDKQKWVNLQIPTTRGNKRKAETALNNLLAELNENPGMLDKIDFCCYIMEWLKKTENTVDIITYTSYHQLAIKHIIPYYAEKHLYLQDVKISDIETYYNYKASNGRLDGKPGGLSLRSIKLHGVVLNLVMKQAVYERLITDNPCEYAKFPKSTNKKREPTFYTVEQCYRLLDCVRGTPIYNMIYITILYGLRRSELLGLRWDAVDFVNDTVTIEHTIVIHDSVVAHKDTTKNKTSKRSYPLMPDIKPMLEKMLEEQSNNKNLLGNGYANTGYVFVKADGNTYYPSYPSHELQKVLKKNDMPHIRWHDLRHSCASMLIDKGWSMKDVSDWLGHADIGTTMNIYGHLSMEHKRKLADGLSGILTIK